MRIRRTLDMRCAGDRAHRWIPPRILGTFGAGDRAHRWRRPHTLGKSRVDDHVRICQNPRTLGNCCAGDRVRRWSIRRTLGMLHVGGRVHRWIPPRNLGTDIVHVHARNGIALVAPCNPGRSYDGDPVGRSQSYRPGGPSCSQCSALSLVPRSSSWLRLPPRYPMWWVSLS